MLTVCMVARIKAGQEPAFESGFAQLAERIAAEPGCAGVTWGATETPREYAIVERYRDQAALEAHRASPHMKQLGPGIIALFDGAPTITRFIERRFL